MNWKMIPCERSIYVPESMVTNFRFDHKKLVVNYIFIGQYFLITLLTMFVFFYRIGLNEHYIHYVIFISMLILLVTLFTTFSPLRSRKTVVKEIKQWCKSSKISVPKVGELNLNVNPLQYEYKIVFKNSQDLMAFKIRWM